MSSLMVIITHLAWRDLGFVRDFLILQMLRLVNEKCFILQCVFPFQVQITSDRNK